MIDQCQKIIIQPGKPDVSLDRLVILTAFLRHHLQAVSCFTLILHGIILDLIRLCFFTWSDIFPLNVRIHHHHTGFIVVQLLYKDRHGFQAKHFTHMLPCMSCNDLVTALFSFPYNSRHQHSMLSDTLNHLFQFFIRTDLKWMVMKLMQLRKRYLFHIAHFCSFLHNLASKEVIKTRQFHIF